MIPMGSPNPSWGNFFDSGNIIVQFLKLHIMYKKPALKHIIARAHPHFAELIRLTKDKITIFTGSPAALFAFLQLGAHGALVAEFQAFPHLVKGVYESFNKGDLADTLEYHEKIMTMFNIIRKHFVGASFAGRYKAILKLRGIDIDLAVRHPGLSVTPEQLKKAEPELMELGLEKIT
jgi:dihydrodipicolinate synthase/N-acetylneuraminate lyase